MYQSLSSLEEYNFQSDTSDTLHMVFFRGIHSVLKEKFHSQTYAKAESFLAFVLTE